VVSPGARLDVRVVPRGQAKPSAALPLEVTLKDSTGAPVAGNITLSLVDDALLTRTGHHLEDPLEALYPALDWQPQSTWSSLQKDEDLQGLIKAVGQSTDRLLGMPDLPRPTLEKIREDFRPMALFQNGLETDKEGRAMAMATMPDSFTRYRLVAMATAPG